MHLADAFIQRDLYIQAIHLFYVSMNNSDCWWGDVGMLRFASKLQ